MSIPRPKPKIPVVNVGEFYARHSETLKMRLVGEQVGFDRRIKEQTINRPGLALAGFYDYFAVHRLQVLGSAELAYLNKLKPTDQRSRVAQMCENPIPGIIVARNREVPKVVVEVANLAGVPVFSTPTITMKFINAATIALEMDFAPTTIEHGSMMDIIGVGVMVRGSSGVGKSECVLGLIERGYSFISDDVTHFRALEGRELLGMSPELTRNHMEVRGLGIINVAAMFGIGSIRSEKRLDMVVTLKDWQELEEVDRIGLEQEFYEILGILVPHVTIPVRTGRDLGRLVEVAALDQKLKGMGQNSAMQFNERLLQNMERTRKS